MRHVVNHKVVNHRGLSRRSNMPAHSVRAILILSALICMASAAVAQLRVYPKGGPGRSCQPATSYCTHVYLCNCTKNNEIDACGDEYDDIYDGCVADANSNYSTCMGEAFRIWGYPTHTNC